MTYYTWSSSQGRLHDKKIFVKTRLISYAMTMHRVLVCSICNISLQNSVFLIQETLPMDEREGNKKRANLSRQVVLTVTLQSFTGCPDLRTILPEPFKTKEIQITTNGLHCPTCVLITLLVGFTYSVRLVWTNIPSIQLTPRFSLKITCVFTFVV